MQALMESMVNFERASYHHENPKYLPTYLYLILILGSKQIGATVVNIIEPIMAR